MPNTPRFGRETQRRRYVVGFAFSPDQSRVVLIAKNREPDNAKMIGTFNGIGGEARAGETYLAAMRREFKEEAGALVPRWSLVAISEGDTWRLYVYATICLMSEWRKVRTLGRSVTDEQVLKVAVSRIRNRLHLAPFYPDVPFLVPLALDAIARPRPVARFDWRQL